MQKSWDQDADPHNKKLWIRNTDNKKETVEVRSRLAIFLQIEVADFYWIQVADFLSATSQIKS